MRKLRRWIPLLVLVLWPVFAIEARAEDVAEDVAAAVAAAGPEAVASTPDTRPCATAPAAAEPKSAARLELRRVDSRLTILENERARHRVTGPAFALGIGLALATWGGVEAAVDGQPSAALLTGTVLSLLVAVGGAVLLAKRVRLRRQHLPEIRELRQHQHHLEREILYGWSVDPATRSVRMGIRF